MVAGEGDRRAQAPVGDRLVDGQAERGALAVAEPRDPRRQALAGDVLARQPDPVRDPRDVGEQLEAELVDRASRSASSPDRQIQRNGPIPRQNSGRR